MTELDGYILPLSTTVEEQERGARVAVLPVGSFEQHGPFLPLATDTVIAMTVARAVCAGRMALFPSEVDWARARTAAGTETPVDDDMHAGELETSILLHAHPKLVRPD